MEFKSLSGQALKEFMSDFSVPDQIPMDGTSEYVGKNTEFMKQVCKHHIDVHTTEPDCQN